MLGGTVDNIDEKPAKTSTIAARARTQPNIRLFPAADMTRKDGGAFIDRAEAETLGLATAEVSHRGLSGPPMISGYTPNRVTGSADGP